MVEVLGQSYEYEGIFFPSFPNMQNNLASLQRYIPKDTDYFLCSYPKSGTHWVNEIIHMLLNEKAEHISPPRPLNNMESRGELCEPGKISDKPQEWCILHSHLPCDLLPSSITRGDRKIVYVMRNPKDQMVSMYHHIQGFKWSPPQTFDQFFQKVMEDPSKVDYGNWFRNAVQWWEDHHDNGNVLFLFYERMLQDLHGTVNKISEFLGKETDENLLLEITRKTEFHAMKKKPVGDWHSQWHKANFSVYRKGKVGEWKNYFTDSMNEEFDQFFNDMMSQVHCKPPIEFE